MSPNFTKAIVQSRGVLVGEGLSMPDGDLTHAAHIDLVGGLLDGPFGVVFAEKLSDQKYGHSNLLAVAAPNLLVPPYVTMITKVTLKSGKQILQMFSDAQWAVARAFAESVESGLIPKDLAPSLCFNAGVFIDAAATDSTLIREHNLAATKLAIEGAVKGVSADDMDDLVKRALAADHPLTELAAKAGKDAAAAAS